MRLYLMRHGRAVEPDEWQGPEAERPLTEAGREEVRVAAFGLRWLDLKMDDIYTSPYARAADTAGLVSMVTGAPISRAEELTPGFDLAALVELIDREPDLQSCRGALLIGHEPDLSEVAGVLIGGSAGARLQMKKASCCRIDLPALVPSAVTLAGSGTLAWLLTAKQLIGLASH
jgi:phosphohistidine phosphatase